MWYVVGGPGTGFGDTFTMCNMRLRAGYSWAGEFPTCVTCIANALTLDPKKDDPDAEG